MLSSTDRVPGSARGARVGGTTFAAIFTAPMLTYDWTLPETKSALLFFPLILFWLVRPWFMGVWCDADVLVHRGWFRTTRIQVRDIQAVTLARYWGVLSRGAIGWLPLIGPIAVLKIRTVNGRARDFPGTVGRRSTVSDVARRIRQQYGIEAGRSERAE